MHLELGIIDLTHDGRGVARHKDKVYFVAGAVPGDRVKARITRSKRKFAEAVAEQLVEASPDRVDPPCAHFGQCGGCQLQDLSVEAQLQWKRQRTQSAFEKAGIDFPEISVVESPEWGYRQRARISVKSSKHGLLMGFRRTGSAEIIPIKQCPVLAGALGEAETWPALHQLLKTFPQRKKLGHVYYLALKPQPVILISHQPCSVEGWLDMAQRFTQATGVAVWHKADDALPKKISGLAEILSYALEWEQLQITFPAHGFIQANPYINEALVNATIDALALSSDDVVVDAYCGVGNFSLPAAKRCKQVFGFDVVNESIVAAKENAKINQLSNVQFVREDLSKPAATYERLLANANKLVLDPGREGALELLKAYNYKHLSVIAYVSCELSSLTRDLPLLLDQGFKLAKVVVFDMFPHTTHQETLVILKKS